MSTHSPPTEPPKRRWVSPHVRTERPATGQVLLCTSGSPFVCEQGGCCDIAPSCDYLCNGG